MAVYPFFAAGFGRPSVSALAADGIGRQPTETPAVGQDLDASASSAASSAIVFGRRAYRAVGGDGARPGDRASTDEDHPPAGAAAAFGAAFDAVVAGPGATASA